MLLALGNAAMPESEKTIAAAGALRAIPTSTADALVDPDACVRLSAAEAYAGRALSDPSFTSLESAAEHDTDRTVRESATESLGTLLATRPTARELLAHIAMKDRDSAVRKAATHALAAANKCSELGVGLP